MFYLTHMKLSYYVCVCVLYLYPITLEVNRLNQIVAETKVTLDNQDQATNRDIWNFFLLLFFFIFVGQCDKQTHPFGIVVVKFLSELPPFQLLHLQLIELWCELILCRQMMWEYIWRRVGKWYGCSTDEACTLVWCVSTVYCSTDGKWYGCSTDEARTLVADVGMVSTWTATNMGVNLLRTICLLLVYTYSGVDPGKTFCSTFNSTGEQIYFYFRSGSL